MELFNRLMVERYGEMHDLVQIFTGRMLEDQVEFGRERGGEVDPFDEEVHLDIVNYLLYTLTRVNDFIEREKRMLRGRRKRK